MKKIMTACAALAIAAGVSLFTVHRTAGNSIAAENVEALAQGTVEGGPFQICTGYRWFCRYQSVPPYTQPPGDATDMTFYN